MDYDHILADRFGVPDHLHLVHQESRASDYRSQPVRLSDLSRVGGWRLDVPYGDWIAAVSIADDVAIRVWHVAGGIRLSDLRQRGGRDADENRGDADHPQIRL